MIKKESRQFNISVEGINCEKMYFEHLAKLINSSDRNTYNLKVDPRKMSPLEYAKRNAYKPVDKRKGNKRIPYIHVQDIEDYYDDFQRTKFYGMIDEMRTAEDKFGIVYELGYSNYTFELWMLLHVADMTHAVQDRHSYLAPINRWFHRNYTDSDEFKSHDEFQKILAAIDALREAFPDMRVCASVGILGDETAKAVVLLASTPKDCTVFQPFNNHTELLGDILTVMEKEGGSMRFVELDEFQQAVAVAGQDPEKAKLLAAMLAYQDVAHGQRALTIERDNRYTCNVLHRLGFNWSDTSSEYISQMIRQIAAFGFFE